MLIDVRDIDSSSHTILPISSTLPASHHPPPSLIEGTVPPPSIQLAVSGSVTTGVDDAAVGGAYELQHVHRLRWKLWEHGVVARVVVDRWRDEEGRVGRQAAPVPAAARRRHELLRRGVELGEELL